MIGWVPLGVPVNGLGFWVSYKSLGLQIWVLQRMRAEGLIVELRGDIGCVVHSQKDSIGLL